MVNCSLRYEIILTPVEDGWEATIPVLPDCVAFGDSETDALAMIQDAKSSWMEASLQLKLVIPEPSA